MTAGRKGRGLARKTIGCGTSTTCCSTMRRSEVKHFCGTVGRESIVCIEFPIYTTIMNYPMPVADDGGRVCIACIAVVHGGVCSFG